MGCKAKPRGSSVWDMRAFGALPSTGEAEVDTRTPGTRAASQHALPSTAEDKGAWLDTARAGKRWWCPRAPAMLARECQEICCYEQHQEAPLDPAGPLPICRNASSLSSPQRHCWARILRISQACFGTERDPCHDS